MISNENFLNYFYEILEFEQDMSGIYMNLSKSIKHQEYQHLFLRISKEEDAHAELVKHLIKLFKDL